MYVVIAEHKAEQALVMETPLGKASYEDARARMDSMIADPRIIRVCIARLVYETGNETILPKKDEQ